MASVKKEPALSPSRETPVASQKRSRKDFESNNAEPANGNACNNRLAGPQRTGPQRTGPQRTGSQSAGPQGAGPQRAGPQSFVTVERICDAIDNLPEDFFKHVDIKSKSKAATIAHVKSFIELMNSGLPELREKSRPFIAFATIIVSPSIGWSKMSWQDKCGLLRQYKSILNHVFVDNVYVDEYIVNNDIQ